MWIPSSLEPRDTNIRLAVITAAQALGAAMGVAVILKPIYMQLATAYPEGIPLSVNVCTNSYDGEGLLLNPVQAYHLHELGLLGNQTSRSQGGFGMDGWTTRYFSSRPLDTSKFYDYLADDSLPAPQRVTDQVP